MGRSVITPGDGDDRHGTDNGYDNLSCRCPECTEAHAVAHSSRYVDNPERREKHRATQAAYRKRKKEQKEREQNGN